MTNFQVYRLSPTLTQMHQSMLPDEFFEVFNEYHNSEDLQKKKHVVFHSTVSFELNISNQEEFLQKLRSFIETSLVLDCGEGFYIL